jgi:tetratricopeptide (TPR) repeat protein
MQIKIFCFSILIFATISLSAQFFFIPIIIPGEATYASHACPSRNEKAYDYMLKGIENLNKNNIVISILYFKGAINKDSMFCDAYDYLTICFIKNKQYDSALNSISQSLKINSSNFWALKEKGFIYYWDKKDYNAASLYFNARHLKQADEPVWLFYLSQSLIKLNLLDSAQNMAIQTQLALQKEGNEQSLEISFFLQGQIAYLKHNYSTALRAFERIKSIYKNNSEFCYYYGMSLLNADNPNVKKGNRFIKRAKRLELDND